LHSCYLYLILRDCYKGNYFYKENFIYCMTFYYKTVLPNLGWKLRAQQPLVESRFTGFRGLTITSLVSVGGYYEIVLSFQGIPPMLCASAKRRVKSNPHQMSLKSKPQTSFVILEILIQDKMPSTSFNGSRRGELNSPFFNHYLFFYSICHAPNRSSIHLINLRIHL